MLWSQTTKDSSQRFVLIVFGNLRDEIGSNSLHLTISRLEQEEQLVSFLLHGLAKLPFLVKLGLEVSHSCRLVILVILLQQLVDLRGDGSFFDGTDRPFDLPLAHLKALIHHFQVDRVLSDTLLPIGELGYVVLCSGVRTQPEATHSIQARVLHGSNHVGIGLDCCGLSLEVMVISRALMGT